MDVTLSRTPEFHLLKLSLSLLLVKSSYFFKLKPNIFSNFIVRTSAFNPGKNFCNFLHDPDFFLRIVETVKTVEHFLWIWLFAFQFYDIYIDSSYDTRLSNKFNHPYRYLYIDDSIGVEL